jgi:hypothetical protein
LAEPTLDYELRDDGVIYELNGGVRVKVQRRSPARVRVTMQRENTYIPPETGDLGTSGFRDRLVALACERFGKDIDLAEELGLIAVAFEAHLEEREEAAAHDDEQTNVPELVGSPYRIVNGGFVRLVNTRGGEIPQRLTNFEAQVDEERVRDDGADVDRIYRVSGKSDRGALPPVDIPAAQFGGMSWPAEAWGLAARIAAERNAKDYVREAIELRSRDAPVRYEYAHTGFRKLPGEKRVFLHPGRTIGAEGVDVVLEPGLEHYVLPPPGGPEEVAEAIRLSFSFLLLAPSRITAPLLAAAYLAPLSEIIVPNFTMWVWGRTGSFKSTLAALILCHYGDFTEDELPLSFESTSNALERSLFVLKDVPAVVDDRRPDVSRADASEMDKKVQRLLRGVGNRQGRNRMNRDTTLRPSYPPRGVVIATAETLPEGPAFESAAARALAIKVSREDVNLERLTELQRKKAALPHAMAGYIGRILSGYDALARKLPPHREKLREELRSEMPGAHPRTPAAAAALIAALDAARVYALKVGAIDKEEAEEFKARVRAGVTEAARAHVEATSGGDPATRFVELLRSLFEAGKVYVKDKESGGQPRQCKRLGWEQTGGELDHDGRVVPTFEPRRGADFVGWAGEVHLFLERDAAYAAVSNFATRGGIPFGIKPRALWEDLKRAGISLADKGRTDTTARIQNKSRRVVQVPLEAILGEDGDRG